MIFSCAAFNTESIKRSFHGIFKSLHELVESFQYPQTSYKYKYKNEIAKIFKFPISHNRSEIYESWPLDYILGEKSDIKKVVKTILAGIIFKKILLLIGLVSLAFFIPVLTSIDNNSEEKNSDEAKGNE